MNGEKGRAEPVIMPVSKSLPNPGYDADMLRRAAEASRNVAAPRGVAVEWFLWVPRYLDQLADRLDPEVPDE